MKTKSTLLKNTMFVLLAFTVSLSKAQLTTNSTTLTPTQLVQNILVGSGITVTGVVYSGDPTARGEFNGAASNVGFTSGMMLSSGDIANAIGPNNTSAATMNFGGTSTDPQLTAIATATLYDPAIIEFDFVPVSDTIKFRYAFGSEEYMEWVGTTFNDVFGFFLTGPNPAGGNYTNQNLAIVPVAGIPVSINNVNLGTNGSYYFDNGDGFGTGTAPDGLTVQYDGFTVPLTAMAAVTCGQTYHIKIAIADVGDGSYDSGVFLEGGSFSSPPLNIALASTAIVAGAPGVFDTVLYEGCSSATLRFQRTGTPCMMAYPSTAFYTISGTATNGVDYSWIGDSIYFPANTDTAFITLNSLGDLLTEGVEYITLTMNSTTTPTSITIAILDAPPMNLVMNNDTTFTCPPGPLMLTAIASGGIVTLPYTYSWTNVTSSTFTASVNPITTTTYYCTVTDACGNSTTDSMTVTVTSYIPMQISLTNDTSICAGDVVTLNATVTNGQVPYNYVWTGGSSSINTMSVSPAIITTYTITVTDNCGQTATNNVTISPQNLEAAFAMHNITNQNLQFENLSAGGIMNWWNFGDGSIDSTSTLSNPQHYYEHDGTYIITLVITNALGCTDTSTQIILVLPDVYFYFPNCFSPNADGYNDLFSGYGYGIKDYRMLIFDRFGEKIYDTRDMTHGWDGSFGGRQVEEGVYVVTFDLKTFKGEEIKKSGHVTLVR